MRLGSPVFSCHGQISSSAAPPDKPVVVMDVSTSVSAQRRGQQREQVQDESYQTTDMTVGLTASMTTVPGTPPVETFMIDTTGKGNTSKKSK